MSASLSAIQESAVSAYGLIVLTLRPGRIVTIDPPWRIITVPASGRTVTVPPLKSQPVPLS